MRSGRVLEVAQLRVRHRNERAVEERQVELAHVLLHVAQLLSRNDGVHGVDDDADCVRPRSGAGGKAGEDIGIVVDSPHVRAGLARWAKLRDDHHQHVAREDGGRVEP